MKAIQYILSGIGAVIILMVSTITYAQNDSQKGTISGLIQDENQASISYADVTLWKSEDSSLVQNVMSDSVGEFEFVSIPVGSYFIKITDMSGSSSTSNIINIVPTQLNVKVPTFVLKHSANSLSDVNVVAIRPIIKYKAGQTTVDVANSTLSAGNTIMEVLQKSPGVLVDKDDNITLNGKSGPMIMINGQPTHLSGTQLAQYLKSVPASSVSKIELMNQPPAKYSAEGTAGIINIVMNKKIATGWNGNLIAGVGYGQYWKYNAGANVSYKGEKLSAYANYNFDHRKNKFDFEVHRYFYTPGTETSIGTMIQNSNMGMETDNHTAQLGIDYDINAKQTIGFVANGSFNNGEFTTYSPLTFKDAFGNIDSIAYSNNVNGYNWQNESINLHHNINLDDSGSSLTTNLDYSHFYQTSPLSMHSYTTDANDISIGNPINRSGKQPNIINIYAAKIDYTKVLKHQMKLSAGIKTSFVKTDNNSEFNIFNNGQWHNDAGNTNHFIYNENVNAAYLSLEKTFKKGWSTNVGVRAEQSNIKTQQITMDSTNKQNYLDFFPNISITKTLDDNNELSLAYTRRIDRPDYQSLNPFIYYIDEYTYRQGNPYLKPQYMNQYSLNYTYKSMYSAGLSYSRTNDIMSLVVDQDPITKVAKQSEANISQLDNVTFNLSIPVTITRWWQTYNSAQVYYNRYKGLYNGYDLNKGYTSFMINTYHIFILPKGWKGELSGMYRSSMIMGPIIVNSMKLVSVGVSKSLWKGKASLKLNVQDLFQSSNFHAKMDFGNLHFNSQFMSNNRAANLTFTWNFGNQNLRVRKHSNSSLKSEEDRIKKGNGGAGGI